MTSSRQAEVLLRLRVAAGGWVDGTELATADVGGSEGLKRLRELRADGFDIQKRKHPDPRRAIFQYRLLPGRNSTVRTIEPHRYSPDYQAMGDCKSCGRLDDDPIHVKDTPAPTVCAATAPCPKCGHKVTLTPGISAGIGVGRCRRDGAKVVGRI